MISRVAWSLATSVVPSRKSVISACESQINKVSAQYSELVGIDTGSKVYRYVEHAIQVRFAADYWILTMLLVSSLLSHSLWTTVVIGPASMYVRGPQFWLTSHLSLCTHSVLAFARLNVSIMGLDPMILNTAVNNGRIKMELTIRCRNGTCCPQKLVELQQWSSKLPPEQVRPAFDPQDQSFVGMFVVRQPDDNPLIDFSHFNTKW